MCELFVLVANAQHLFEHFKVAAAYWYLKASFGDDFC
jgi:hypothetical protein